jgi:hypothetical protein
MACPVPGCTGQVTFAVAGSMLIRFTHTTDSIGND